MFTTIPTYNPYRTLALFSPPMRGEDVFGLQHALNAVTGSHLDTDGVLGSKTAGGIHAAQQKLHLVDDGKAGVITQRALALSIAKSAVQGTQYNLTRGQLSHESSYLLGNYSALRSDGSYDAGVAQMNTSLTPPSDGFNPVYAIGALILRTRAAYGTFHDTSLFRGEDHSDHRRWMLAAGAWNAPAFANYLAGVRPWAVPGADALQTFEQYMTEVSVYLS